MYRPHHNDWTDRDAILAFCKAHPFAMLVSVDKSEARPDEARPVVTHVPVTIRTDGDAVICTTHIARPNTQWKSIENQQVLIVFAGPHAYISPRGYEEIDVPTWNYIAVHMYGTARIIHDREEIRRRLQTLVEQHDDNQLWSQLVPEHVEPLLGGIVMMDITITDIQGKRKMSQNRNSHDRAYGEREVYGEHTAQGGNADSTLPSPA
mgnify:CR=1 FL=1